MDKCPACGADSMFAENGPWIDYQGQPHYGRRVPVYCNDIMCDQRFWWHPVSGRVTRRNTGITWAEHRRRRGLPDLQRRAS